MAGIKAFFAKATASKATLAAYIGGAVLVVGGIGAAAYYGIVVPNKPENVLKSSVKNLLEADQSSGSGKATMSGKDIPGITVGYSLQTDKTKPAAAGKVDASVSGVNIPFEFVVIDKSAYLKVGDLTTLKGLASGFAGPEAGKMVDKVASSVSNKWIEFDESLIKTVSKNECDVLGSTISQDELNQIMDIYEKNSFVTIKSTSQDTVDGKKLTKYDLGLDKNTANSFANDLKQVDIFKKLEKCGGGSGGEAQKEADQFNGTTELSVWVDKGAKKIEKIAFKVSDSEATLDADYVFNDKQVSIQKPENSVPAMQVITELQPLLGGSFPGL